MMKMCLTRKKLLEHANASVGARSLRTSGSTASRWPLLHGLTDHSGGQPVNPRRHMHGVPAERPHAANRTLFDLCTAPQG